MGFDPCKDRSVTIERLRSASDRQREQMIKLSDENERLKRDLKNSYIHQDEYKKAADDATELNRKLSDENDELQKKYLQADDSITQMHRECSRMSKELDAVNKENADLKQQISAKEIEVIKPRYDDDIVMGMIIDSEVKKTKIEVYEEEIKMLKQMVFNMIKSY
jgi:chromosome segregation ATPase